MTAPLKTLIPGCRTALEADVLAALEAAKVPVNSVRLSQMTASGVEFNTLIVIDEMVDEEKEEKKKPKKEVKRAPAGVVAAAAAGPSSKKQKQKQPPVSAAAAAAAAQQPMPKKQKPNEKDPDFVAAFDALPELGGVGSPASGAGPSTRARKPPAYEADALKEIGCEDLKVDFMTKRKTFGVPARAFEAVISIKKVEYKIVGLKVVGDDKLLVVVRVHDGKIKTMRLNDPMRHIVEKRVGSADQDDEEADAEADGAADEDGGDDE